MTAFTGGARAGTRARSAPYAERFQFELPQGGTEDPDEIVNPGAAAHQSVEKVKDVLTRR